MIQALVVFIPLTNLGQLITHSFSNSCDEKVQSLHFQQEHLISTGPRGLSKDMRLERNKDLSAE